MERGGGFTAEDLSTMGGIATVSLLHSFIPTHWLPFSIVGRAQKWTLSRTLIVTALGAVLHVLSTSLLGVTAITISNTIAGEETVHKLASLLLIVLGGSYIILFFSGKGGGHSHSHNQPMEKMAVAGLVLVPALSPCATTLPVFLAVGNSSTMLVLAIIVLLLSPMPMPAKTTRAKFNIFTRFLSFVSEKICRRNQFTDPDIETQPSSVRPSSTDTSPPRLS
ncbi:hypothetical protein DM860_011452 [Cuscuta australis]|uniref:Cytochrome C biogenesis protein transmembrane domain-containing protein n=1 Tax=Cuscuta australis TaxID=267555 RepID=A0A328DQC0_9ASTE|nr:hypothetical protein DM860_011452 [Cuscuta australis]